MRRSLAAFLVLASVASLAAFAAAEELENGIHFAAFDGTEGVKGARVARHDGGHVILTKWLGRSFGTATMRSVSNNNTTYFLQLKGVGPLAKPAEDVRLAAVIEGICLLPGNTVGPADDGRFDLSYTIHGKGPAETVAKYLGIEPELRRHPGHRFEVRFAPDRESYAIGEQVPLTMTIRNTGEAPFTFFVGGRQRGPRDNQFRFLAYAGHGLGKAVPDTGDPLNFGGKGWYETLKPGESFRRQVSIEKWFKFAEADRYRVTGIFEIGIYRSREREFDEVIWDDLATGDCLVRIVEPEKRKE